MYRLSRRLCQATGSKRGATGDSKQRPPQQITQVTIDQAYRLFGYSSLADTVDRKDVKAKYMKLAMKMHPDRGGSEEEFKLLTEAYKIMKTANMNATTTGGRHEEGNSSPGKGEKGHVFTRGGQRGMNARDERFGTNRSWAFQMENASFDYKDVCAGVVVGVALWYWWISRCVEEAVYLSDSRSRMLPDEVKPVQMKAQWQAKHEYHPWRATTAHIDEVIAAEAGRQERIKADKAGDLRVGGNGLGSYWWDPKNVHYDIEEGKNNVRGSDAERHPIIKRMWDDDAEQTLHGSEEDMARSRVEWRKKQQQQHQEQRHGRRSVSDTEGGRMFD